jgi:hypothetical protein
MRVRAVDHELEYYAQAKRDGLTVRVQSRDWKVVGITADRVPNPSAPPTPGALQGEQQQYWIELQEEALSRKGP